jgi:tRNA threonylcarbamoyladenosine biosynthesis protein TsaB
MLFLWVINFHQQEMVLLSYDKCQKSDIENVAYFEPFYLKDFVVIPEKKKIK